MNSPKIRTTTWLMVATPLVVLLLFSKDRWASPGHWWFGGSNYNFKINDIPQGDYSIYRAVNGDALITCWDHMTEYYVSVSDQKIWEIHSRQEVTVDGMFFLYLRNSLSTDATRNSRLKKIESPNFKMQKNVIDFTDSLGQQITISF